MSKQIQTTDDAQTTKQPLRFQVTVEWQRRLDHDVDNPERLKERLSVISVDGDVSVRELADTSATVWIETAPDEMEHTPALIEKTVRRVFRNYNARVIDADDVTDIPTGAGVKPKVLKHAYRGKTRDDYPGHVAKEDWQKAKRLVADLSEGAPNLETDISLRTIDGKL